MLTRRTFAGRTLVLFALGALGLATVTAARPRTHDVSVSSAPHGVVPSNDWLNELTGTHRQFFDNPTPNGGIALVHVMNYYDTYNQAFGVKDGDINAVLTFYGGTTFYGLNDAAWSKYKLGEFLGTNDPATGKLATSNPWRVAPVVLGMTLPAASLESLHKRGATLILCNNALQLFSAMLAAKRGLETKDVYEDLKANILPGVQLVPGMVIAVEQAQRAGLTYHRQ